ncbi:PREDICTED: G-type lectin S-receptor-like serine/threonine-protein kinase LECRK3 [Theobroma cacao]|uniref:Receptor-like serine/threonine-protein kinase n=1 Tax=Theobroma cacao TaxID=3641 RepID=A0AB32WSX0_THECC|nr:PREDICTED: G-type lectin S-receptor-like serine/threonine-protein kinase LECRK3 [Theobroma cacao]
MTFSFLIFCFIFLWPISVVAQIAGNVSVGASLLATEYSSQWLSPSGDFAFGFRQVNNNKDLFIVAIWYNKIPEKTIVWYANGDRPVPRGSKLELFLDSGLVLNGPQGEVLWSAQTINTSFVAYGFMNDTGNFVLLNENLLVVWESFKNPTDTMLPTQILQINEVLASHHKETDFSRGRFQFRLREDGNVVLTPIDLLSNNTYDPYYITNTGDTRNSTNSGYQVIFDESGYFYVLSRNNTKFYLTPEEKVPAANSYHRATLNFDGVFTLSYHPKNFTDNQSWTVIKTIRENICRSIYGEIGSGACGYNNVCILKNDGRPMCKCPPNYSLLDPDDEYGSCKPDFILGCQADGLWSQEDLYDMEELPNTDWPTSDYELSEPFTERQCRVSCLQDCMCAVSIFRNGDKCWKKKLPLSNGRVDNLFYGLKAFVKVSRGDQPQLNPRSLIPKKNAQQKSKNKLIILLAVLLTSSVIASSLGFIFIYRNKRTRVDRDTSVETNLRCFAYKELQEATNGFKHELGRGAFGVVYKGTIRQGSFVQVAVKKLNNVAQDGEKEFRTEVNVIGQTHHKNLVRLLGFCEDGPQRLLVYEFLSNGTLASLLFGEFKPSWNQRVQIAFGIARGLLYLHEECSNQIIHCDIKPQNILLDEYYNARISDFGLAKLLFLDQSQTSTAIRGTKGYVAPEWFRNLPITVKVDVYSFGVLLLEIICCRRSVDTDASGSEKIILTYWAFDCYQERTLDALVENDMEALNDTEKLERFVAIAIWCIQEDPSLRPTMKKVTQMLEGVLQVPIPPCPTPFIMTN